MRPSDGEGFGIPMIAMLPLPGDAGAQEAEFALSPGLDLKLVTAALSDTGCVRLNNEDAFGMFGDDARGPGTLLLVADGLGGHAAGETASRLAVEVMQGAYFTTVAGVGMDAALTEALGTADAAVRTAADEGPATLGMGTTCTAAAIDGHALVVGHVGDSRAYLVAMEGLVRLTTDHTLAGEFERVAGAENLVGDAHVLTRCLGGGGDLKCEVSHDPMPLVEGDAIVLCTDGLSGVVDDEEIESAVRQRAPADACRFLVETARERGGPDNITVLVARVERGVARDASRGAGRPRRRGPASRPFGLRPTRDPLRATRFGAGRLRAARARRASETRSRSRDPVRRTPRSRPPVQPAGLHIPTMITRVSIGQCGTILRSMTVSQSSGHRLYMLRSWSGHPTATALELLREHEHETRKAWERHSRR